MFQIDAQIGHSNEFAQTTCESLIRATSSSWTLKRPNSDALSRTNSMTSVGDETCAQVSVLVEDGHSSRRVRHKGFSPSNSVMEQAYSNERLFSFSSPSQSFTTGDVHRCESPFWFRSPVPSFSSGETAHNRCCFPLTTMTVRNGGSSNHSLSGEELDQLCGTISDVRVPALPEYVCSDHCATSGFASLELEDGYSDVLNRFMESMLNDLDQQEDPQLSPHGHLKSMTENEDSANYPTHGSTLVEGGEVTHQNSVVAMETIEPGGHGEPSQLVDVLSVDICSLLESPSWKKNKINTNIDIQAGNFQQTSFCQEERTSGPSENDPSQQHDFHPVDLSADVNCLWKPDCNPDTADLQFGNSELTQGKCLQEGIYKFCHNIPEEVIPEEVLQPVGLQEENEGIAPSSTQIKQPVTKEDHTVVLDPIIPVAVRATGIPPDGDYNGIRLIHLLIAGSEAVASRDLDLGTVIVARLQELVSPIGSTIQRVATYFCDGLQYRIEGGRGLDRVTDKTESYNDVLTAFQILHETSPYIKFGHFTANQAILEAVDGEKRIHIIDYEIMEGIQWSSLMQALTLRQGELPHLRITSLYRPHDKRGFDTIQETGKRLTEFAASLNLKFTFSQVRIDCEEDFRPSVVKILKGEIIVANCIVHLPHMPHRTATSVSSFLQGIRKLCPRVLTLVEDELGCTSSAFTSHFFDALHHYSAIFDSLEVTLSSQTKARTLVERVFLAPRIASTVTFCGSSNCSDIGLEFAKRTWCSLVTSAGFKPIRPSVHNLCQARLLLGLFKDGFKLDEDCNRLLLAWRSKPLIAASVWTCK